MDAVEDGMWWYRALHARMLEALGPPRGGYSMLAAVREAFCSPESRMAGS